MTRAQLLADGAKLAMAAPAEYPTSVPVSKSTLKRRHALVQNFLTGTSGVELTGFEAAAATDRRQAKQRSKAWRE